MTVVNRGFSLVNRESKANGCEVRVSNTIQEVREVYFRWTYLKPEVDSVGLRVTTVVQMNFLEVCTLDQNRGQNG